MGFRLVSVFLFHLADFYSLFSFDQNNNWKMLNGNENIFSFNFCTTDMSIQIHTHDPSEHLPAFLHVCLSLRVSATLNIFFLLNLNMHWEARIKYISMHIFSTFWGNTSTADVSLGGFNEKITVLINTINPYRKRDNSWQNYFPNDVKILENPYVHISLDWELLKARKQISPVSRCRKAATHVFFNFF